MNARRCRSGWWIGLGLLFATSLPVHADVTPLACPNGYCEWIQPAGSPPCYAVVGSLAPSTQSFVVRVQAEATRAAAMLVRDDLVQDQRPDLAEWTRQAERWRRLRQVPEVYPPRNEPARRKLFYLFTADRDIDNPGNYVQITAEVCALSKHVQVYLDCRDPMTPELDLAVNDTVRTFEQEVLPWATQNLGRVVDIDRDGRFTVLFSSWLSKLQGGKSALDGFVSGSDFLRDVAPPFGNRCDMLWLNPRLKAGPHLQTIVAHEYTHAVTFCEHVLNNPPEYRREEEGWLSEGLAHLVEDIHQHGWSNLDYRVRAYLAQPERYPLVVADYFNSGLWRTPGTRGSTFLFLRWCSALTPAPLPAGEGSGVRAAGAELARNLTQSPYTGVRNLELATQQSFSKLYRDWAVSLIQNDSWRKDSKPRGEVLRTPRLSTEDKDLMLFGPAFQTLNEGTHDFTLVGTGLKYILIPGGSGVNQHIRIYADHNARLQVTLVEVDRRRGFLDVSCQVAAQDNRLIVEAKALGSPVRLEGIAYEKVPPDGTGLEGTGYRDLADHKTPPVIETGAIWTSTFAQFLPADRRPDLLVRVLGKDSQGRNVVGCSFVKGTGAK